MMNESVVSLRPHDLVTIQLAATVIGLTEKAIRRKIEDGHWIAGREYRRAPDSRIYIHLPSVSKWVEQGQA